MTDNLAIWEALGKTDPRHTKSFKRAGGFSGTALKPIWVTKMLTAHFGPAGKGWGVNKPDFQVVPAGNEILVYCTVSAWHGSPENVLWGVGGDKVQAKRSSGDPFCDDEAFKKAFTDAVNNAFKSLGVGADIHMGMFEDDKYVTATKAEFAEQEAANEPAPNLSESDRRLIRGVDDAPTIDAVSTFWKANAALVRESTNREYLTAYKERRKAGLTAVASLN